MRPCRLTDSQLVQLIERSGFELMSGTRGDYLQKSFPHSQIRRSFDVDTAEAGVFQVAWWGRGASRDARTSLMRLSLPRGFAKNASKRITSVDNAMTAT